MKSVPDRLSELGNLYKERNALYGSNYKFFGRILIGMFPKGLTLRTEADFNRFALLLNIMHKMTRYARSINGEGHADSLDDVSVYAQMLQEYDEEIKQLIPDCDKA